MTTLLFKAVSQLESCIYVGCNIISKIADIMGQIHSGKRVLILTQPAIAWQWSSDLVNNLKANNYNVTILELPDGEECKSESQLFKVWKHMQEHFFDRQDTIIGLGGGSISDLAGFAASTYLRGIKLVLIPTTLLAQVDAALGGKTAINLEAGKNLAGTFYFPNAVLADCKTLATLPSRQIKSGLSEIIKYALIEETVMQESEYKKGQDSLLSALEKNLDASFNWDHPALASIIITCAKMKLSVVAADPHEKALRRCLNLGHTLAHALEKSSSYELTHGEAVAIGLVFALRLSVQMKKIEEAEAERIISLLMRVKLPVTIPHHLSKQEIVLAISQDKKRQGNFLKFILPVGKLGVVDVACNVAIDQMSSLLGEFYSGS